MKMRRLSIILTIVALAVSPLYSASATQQKTTAKPKTTQTAKPASKPASTTKTTAKPASTTKTTAKPAPTAKAAQPAAKPAPKVNEPVKAEPVDFEDSRKYASNPEGWWNELWTDAHFSYDLYVKSTLLRGFNVPGGGLSMGVETDKFRFEGYGQADYFLQPFGGEGGIATFEMSAELGVNAAWKFLEFWAFDVWAACDIGYYTQLVNGLPYPPYKDLIMGYSGLMIRPKLLTELKICKYYGITMGVYYQMPVYPAYSDYSGLGIMLSIC